jgi:hypothetical protein
MTSHWRWRYNNFNKYVMKCSSDNDWYSCIGWLCNHQKAAWLFRRVTFSTINWYKLLNPFELVQNKIEVFKGDTLVDQRWGPSSLIHQSINRNWYMNKNSEWMIWFLGLILFRTNPRKYEPSYRNELTSSEIFIFLDPPTTWKLEMLGTTFNKLDLHK